MVTLYGIPNCDTVKKARAWLTARGVMHTFHDFKKAGVPADRLPAWIKATGLDKLLNRQGTTWRKLEPATQAGAAYEAGALALMLANTLRLAAEPPPAAAENADAADAGPAP